MKHRLALLLVRLLVPLRCREELWGDLLEEAAARGRRWSPLTTNLWIWKQLLLSGPSLLVMRMRRERKAALPSPVGHGADAPLSRCETQRVFDSFLAVGDRHRPRRRIMLVLSIAGHAALLVAAVVASGWHVDELHPPNVVITWVPVPPPRMELPINVESKPPPKGPPPRVKHAGSVSPKSVTQPPLPAPEVQPPAPQETPPSPAGDGDGQRTSDDPPGVGTKEGPPGPSGGGGSKIDGGGPPRTLPPDVGTQRCASCPSPHLPPATARVAVRPELLARVCVDARGNVSSVKVLRGIDGAADAGIVAVLREWKFEPLQLDGHPVPFCYVVRFIFEMR